ncbi:hypothetical protein JYT83_00335 [bacterium AH-315-F18]|nr:hypothetical protein [bacterium AH-315-F18]
MAKQQPTKGELVRLDEIAKNLGIRKRWGSEGFMKAAVDAAMRKVNLVLHGQAVRAGADVLEALASHYSIAFERVRKPGDILELENKYLREQREIGFAQLREEFSDPGVDAVLFRRTKAATGLERNWIAVLNLQDSPSREYWDIFHEIAHRVAEPDQLTIRFRRHRAERTNPVEALVDQIASGLAFYPPVFAPLVAESSRNRSLSIPIVEAVRDKYAPNASLMATCNAVVKHWPRPAQFLTASVRGRLSSPGKDVDLRISLQCRNDRAKAAGLVFFANMRPPKTSPVRSAYSNDGHHESQENLASWTTSSGKTLGNHEAITSAQKFGETVYALVSIGP